MRVAGIDIGSRTVKLIVVEEGNVVVAKKRINSHDPLVTTRELLRDVPYDRAVATGYGRHLLKRYLNCDVISEIRAFALGAKALIPSCRTILDIGGQDTKAISLNEAGDMIKFEMNDKCAAGTGRFLEVMATALGFSLEDFATAALSAARAEKINSMCTVFAESEVVSLVAQGARRNEVALGIHGSIVGRSIALLNRVGVRGDIVFAGGVALNRCVRQLIESRIGVPVVVPADPQTIGALGSALYGASGLVRGDT
ncbi:MAG: acyl-CoA dehydratase activase [Deltaproteobacteria bacterium]|nr:acyl-CoA dehydratase activase [Deltaproteobacteria bacterium]